MIHLVKNTPKIACVRVVTQLKRKSDMSTGAWIAVGVGVVVLLIIVTKGKIIKGLLEVVGEIFS